MILKFFHSYFLTFHTIQIIRKNVGFTVNLIKNIIIGKVNDCIIMI